MTTKPAEDVKAIEKRAFEDFRESDSNTFRRPIMTLSKVHVRLSLPLKLWIIFPANHKSQQHLHLPTLSMRTVIPQVTKVQSLGQFPVPARTIEKPAVIAGLLAKRPTMMRSLRTLRNSRQLARRRRDAMSSFSPRSVPERRSPDAGLTTLYSLRYENGMTTPEW